MKISKERLLIIIAGIVMGMIVISTSIQNVGQGQSIHIEAEDASLLEHPFEIIEDAMASGGKAVTSSLRSDEYEASLVYNIRISQSGRYRFWANCLWPGGCNNSFELQFDDGNKYVFGNDKGKFEVWHLVKGPVITLQRGEHELRIWNKESFSQIDKIILTSNLNDIPEINSSSLNSKSKESIICTTRLK